MPIIIGLIIIASFLSGVALNTPYEGSLRGVFGENNLPSPTQFLSPTPSIFPSPTVTNVPTKIIYYDPPPTIDPDPVINCNFSDNCNGQSLKLRRSECSKTVCCQIGSQWTAYTSNEKCDQDQEKFYKPASNSNNSVSLVNCTVSYPCTGNSYTYRLTEESCNYTRQSALSVCNSQGSGNTNFTIPTSSPLPTTSVPTPDQSLIERHKQACNNAAAEWIGMREKWEAENYNNYSSSAEAVQALLQYMAQYQAELYSAGCSNRISL